MYAPRRCGVRYDPPMLILEYVIISTGKLRRRSMPLKDFKKDVSIPELAAQVKKSKHAMYLEKVSQRQIERLLEHVKSHTPQQQSVPSHREQAQGDSGSSEPDSPSPGYGKENEMEIDLNKLSDSELERQKARMDVLFEANRKRPDDEGFVYDLEVDFGKEGRMESGWDIEDDDDDEF